MDIFLNIPWEYPALFLIGIIVGFINTMAGGGSLITLPVLIFMGLPSSVANGTNRIGILFSSFSAHYGFKSKGINTFPFSIYLGISALLGSLIGAKIAISVEDDIFNKILSVIIIVVSILILFKPKTKLNFNSEKKSTKEIVISCIVFFFIGIYGGFVNAGIGLVVMLFLSYFNKMNLVKVNATKSIVILIYTAAAFLIFLYNDLVNFPYGISIALGTLYGGWKASVISVEKGEGIIKVFMIISLIIISVKLWFF